MAASPQMHPSCMADDRRNYHDIGSARTSSISQVGATILIHEAACTSATSQIGYRRSSARWEIPRKIQPERDSRALTVLVGMSAEPDVAALLPHMAGDSRPTEPFHGAGIEPKARAYAAAQVAP